MLLLLTLLLGSYVSAAGLKPVEKAKVDYLIATVEALQGAQFIRNGSSYDAKAAAEHLRLKLATAGARIETAEDFIQQCASRSSISGKAYQIRFADGRVVTSESYLRQKLAEFAATHEPT